jgi:hypothetical protein
MDEFLASPVWLYAVLVTGGFFAGLAACGAGHMYRLWVEDKAKPAEALDLEGGFGYDEDRDVTRIMVGLTGEIPVVAGIVVEVEPILREPPLVFPLVNATKSGSSRYQELSYLSGGGSTYPWAGSSPHSAAPQGATPLQRNGPGVHRAQNLVDHTQEIDVNELWKMINTEEGLAAWQAHWATANG